MLIVIAPDSFKECLSATEVAESIMRGILRIAPDAEIRKIPMADGGEGTVEALVAATGGQIHQMNTLDPLMRPIIAKYGVLGNVEVAVIEMAAASGLALVEPENRNPLKTSTYGTGLMIKHALEQGFKRIILGIGGSATNDGGAGMAQALGFQLLDSKGNEIAPGGGNLHQIAKIDGSNKNPMLANLQITVACDVTNPLCGPYGASAIFGPQKGANTQMVTQLDTALGHFAEIISRDLQREVADFPGAGAAGGLGAGLMAFTNATLAPGFQIISDLTNLEDSIANCDLVFTAEGRIDHQTQFGKTPIGVAKLARKYNKPLIALAGSVGSGTDELHELGITAIFSIANGPISMEESMTNAPSLLEKKAEQVMRLFFANGLS
ncbi:MAG: glycerate kinase [Cyclobacteriaceae bacterium]|nr:glycerate kinase [Cyclobacteriaceae bacterium]